ncbi:MAG: helix-turn-helix domain-containing protein [Candidatus Aminicenantes bacterium]|nr:helix-turn-helix domain-containing protein [Candidatus Aminicenantes bacterium]NIM79702.1 helix-turn-helix domain-containing protein [Candidatus Aminicenantes bacterium]NIN19032.1 helix-turn-helix domain-containing protein [Candidatus Aminicenantes bacterium]NIN42934.1 helix-turn-helix domain-containing protein [Candidatus Aminicenantes bacterium]NIN85671.1 helix-turn-helix domain-containing protein [Candidatus Aminicenantes bacterium]
MKKQKNKGSDSVVEFILTCSVEELASLGKQKIAETLGLDPARMSEAFEADQRISVEQFIIREKLHRSVFILDEDCEISIDDLAEKLGFRETEQFAREFESYLLIPPQRYKEIIQQEQIKNSRTRAVGAQLEFQIQ